MILRIAPGCTPGEFPPVAAPDLPEVAALLSCDVSTVRYRHTHERPARVLLFDSRLKPGTYNQAATSLLPHETRVPVYGVALVADIRAAAPIIEAVKRRSRAHCAHAGCTSFAAPGSMFCRAHSDTSEESARRKTNNAAVGALLFLSGACVGYARHESIPFASALFWVGVLGFILGAWKRGMSADKPDKLPAGIGAAPILPVVETALPRRRIVRTRARTR